MGQMAVHRSLLESWTKSDKGLKEGSRGAAAHASKSEPLHAGGRPRRCGAARTWRVRALHKCAAWG